MTFPELIAILSAAAEEDWHVVPCSRAAPAYRDRFTFYEVKEGTRAVLQVESHTDVAVYKPDIAITLAFGLADDYPFRAEWTRAFPDATASRHFVDVFYQGALVYRDICIRVDGGRGYLPMPRDLRSRQVPRAYAEFIRLVDLLAGHTDYDANLLTAEIKPIDMAWP